MKELQEADTELTAAKEIVLKAYKAAVEAVNAQPENAQKVLALKRLVYGSVRRSKVWGVISPAAVEKVIEDLSDLQSIKQKEDKTWCYRFSVPGKLDTKTSLLKPKYITQTPVSRPVDLFPELLPDGRVTDKEAVMARLKKMHLGVSFTAAPAINGGGWRWFLVAPKLTPPAAEVLCFVLDEAKSMLMEWWAGEDISMFHVDFSAGRFPVYLGADLTAENLWRIKKYASTD